MVKLFIPVVVLCFTILQYKRLVSLPEGTSAMELNCTRYSPGADAFLYLEYKHLSVYALGIAIALAILSVGYVSVAFTGLFVSSLQDG